MTSRTSRWLALLGLVLILATPAAVDARTCAQCGGDGEPGCCLFEGCGFVGCATNVTVTGCSGTDCGCSSNRCYDKVPCGGAGQRACCVIEGPAPCGGGLVEFPGCSGFGACLCGDIAGIAVFSSGTCGDPQCGGPGQRGCCIGADRAAEGRT